MSTVCGVEGNILCKGFGLSLCGWVDFVGGLVGGVLRGPCLSLLWCWSREHGGSMLCGAHVRADCVVGLLGGEGTLFMYVV